MYEKLSEFYMILLLARYVPNVAKRSIYIYEISKKNYILRTDRPTNDRPTSHLGKFQMAIRKGSSDPLHVWF